MVHLSTRCNCCNVDSSLPLCIIPRHALLGLLLQLLASYV